MVMRFLVGAKDVEIELERCWSTYTVVNRRSDERSYLICQNVIAQMIRKSLHWEGTSWFSLVTV